MSYRPPWRRPRPAPEPKRVAPVPPVIAMRIAEEEFNNLPWGGFQGEMLPDAPAAPPPAPPAQWRPPPPEWQAQLEAGDLDLASLEPPAPSKPMDALAEMKSVDITDDDWPAPPGPPMVLQPLTRPRVPEVDWRAEAEERARREREASPVEIESVKSLQSRPAAPRRREERP
jgi:hypothetical protein